MPIGKERCIIYMGNLQIQMSILNLIIFFFSLSRFYAGPTAIIVIHYSDDSITQYLRMKNKFQLKSIYVLFTNGYKVIR